MKLQLEQQILLYIFYEAENWNWFAFFIDDKSYQSIIKIVGDKFPVDGLLDQLIKQVNPNEHKYHGKKHVIFTEQRWLKLSNEEDWRK